MKKLVLFMLLSVSAPLFAVISDAQYAQQVANYKDELFNGYASGAAQVPESLAESYEIDKRLVVEHPLYLFAQQGNLDAVQYLIEVKRANPNEIVGTCDSINDSCC